MGVKDLIRADEAAEIGIARILEQFSRRLAATRRRGGSRPSDAYFASKALAALNAILRFHLQKYALYAAAAAGASVDDAGAAERALMRASRSLRAQIAPLRAGAPAYPLSAAMLAELEAFPARKRDALSGPTSEARPSPPWLHPNVPRTARSAEP
ncbi:hypothetical protein FE782_27690 [Paenibacillus antri]|uniref:Uncharacterized protein n=1 Tax=Paenibacillus antri TaxID=2582848 RepID=A0A5R9G207_9BACL|nr:hypothetical protein [Paenibacillus antri]TLS49059.1 hypothetical protein FE782_27690 [Paenibacillus antri]